MRAINAEHKHEQLADKDHHPPSTITLTVWKDHPSRIAAGQP
jgi:hypothetical protein